jgi:hypothetical protein
MNEDDDQVNSIIPFEFSGIFSRFSRLSGFLGDFWIFFRIFGDFSVFVAFKTKKSLLI